jgi:C_GCAxxG_C_C family probable redox protein
MNAELVPQVRQWAEQSFGEGLFCAESVVLALARAQGIESDVLPKVATAFCGGMARTCGTCGALTGAVMGLGLATGRSSAAESAQPAYAAAQRLITQFELEFGSRDCHALLGCDLGTPHGQATFREQHLARRCTEFTGRAAEMAAAILADGAGAQSPGP